MVRKVIGSIGLSALLGAAGCGVSTELSEEYEADVRTDAITRGKLVPATAGAPDTSAVRLNGGCSGIKIGPRQFLTAAHCGFQNVSTVAVTNHIDGSTGTVNLTISSVDTHPMSMFPTPSDGLYQDFQIINVVQTTGDIPVYNILRPTHVPVGTTGAPTSYGCDHAVPENGGKKQYGFFTTEFNDDQLGWDKTWFVATGEDQPAVCPGDSGGPFFVKRNNVWEIAGLVSAGNGYSFSMFSRVSAVYAWLKDPRYNVLENGRKGFLLNRESNKPVGLPSNSSTSQPEIQVWDGREHSGGADVQYWKLVSVGSGRFRIQNTKTLTCLEAHSSGVVKQTTCAARGAQYWRFQNLSQSFYQIENQATSKCMAIETTTVGTPLKHVTCSGSSYRQRWMFSN